MTNQTLSNIKTFYQANPWKGRTIIALLSIVIVLGAVRLALPQTIIYSATSWLEKRDIDSTIEAININIFDGTVSLINAKGSKDGKPLFNIGLIDIHWHWSPLSKKTVVVTKVVLDELSVDIEHFSDQLIVGGVHIPLGGTDTETDDQAADIENKKAKPWAASLGEVVFTNLNICYLQNTNDLANAAEDSKVIDYCVDLKEMTWGGTIGYAIDPKLPETTDLILSSTGTFQLNGLTITNNILKKYPLTSSTNTLKNVVISGLNAIHIDSLEMNGLSALQREDTDHKDAIRFQQLSIKDINFTDLNSLAINSIDIKEPGLYLVKLNNTDWEYQQWLPPTPSSDDTSNKNANKDSSTFTLSLDNIAINNSDFCYVENTNKLNYCFTQKNISWDGSIKSTTGADDIKLAINGNLVATDTTVSNQTLKRDLVDIKNITLSNLDVNDIDKATFDNLVIKNLTALQRSDKRSDATLAFSSLALSKTEYAKDSIKINSIDLDGLSSYVSKNKDGAWEHDKWIPKSNAKEKSKPTDKQTSQNKSILVSIKSVNIKTDKDILFTDNTTKPSMKVGLSKLTFNIDDLVSNRPDSDSPFKLFAKTIRHSTINITGTVRPYAEKLSFDAKGKLKGFDLRAATPETKKTIGHIIKSGQLDADLELLAVDGQLDSNIGLSLYQFHIKPMSKDDSAKLDKELGMPLNQTLTLLRNKDDSIHLDIPITGDTSNPDFSPMHAIVKATTAAATVTLITFYTPYGLIYAGGNVLFDLATAMNFDPIAFTPGSSKLPADGEKQLDNLAKLLTEKPQVHLTLCGMTNKDDAFSLYPDLKQTNEKDKKEVHPALSKKQTIALRKLATERQDVTKNYLIDTAKITHDRLILCDPEHQIDTKAFSGVDVNI
ncbi:MAG: DUF748 domain-containing protein [Gammaproteobacteria bacterium]|nr:DUF748 domain-containing protein [Gammaproteobacteria bacterium]